MARRDEPAGIGLTSSLTPEVEVTLRRYVLGDLEEGPRAELEERFVTDPDAFEVLGLIEDELIEEYLDERGARGDRHRFENHFLARPEGVRRFRLARALRERASVEALESVEPRFAPGRLTRTASMRAFVGIAAALAVSIAGNVWLTSRHIGDDPREPLPPVEVPSLRPAVATRDFASELAAQQEARAAAEAQLRTLEAQLQRPAPSVRTFTLAAGLLRGEGSLAQVSVPVGAVVVGLRLVMPGDDYPRYRVALLDADGDEIWVGSKLQADGPADQRAVPVLLPAGFLARGDYQARLSGLPERGEPEVVRTYAFRVSRP